MYSIILPEVVKLPAAGSHTVYMWESQNQIFNRSKTRNCAMYVKAIELGIIEETFNVKTHILQFIDLKLVASYR